MSNHLKQPYDMPPNSVKARSRQNLFEYIAVNILCLFIFIAFGYVAVMSVLQTCVIDPSKYVSEKILYQNDIVILNILLTVGFIALLFCLRRFYDFFAKVNMLAMEIGMTALVVIFGLMWVLTVRSIPAADSYNLYEAATQAAQGAGGSVSEVLSGIKALAIADYEGNKDNIILLLNGLFLRS